MIKIKRAELRGKDVGRPFHFPDFTADILELAGRKSHGATKKVVGKPLEMIADFDGKTYEQWRAYYEGCRPGSLDRAVDLILDQVEKFRAALELVDRDLVQAWVEERVLKVAFASARFNEVILKRLAILQDKPFSPADADAAAAGVDGFIEGKPFMVKPVAHYFKGPPDEVYEAEIIYYEKAKDGIKVYYDL